MQITTIIFIGCVGWLIANHGLQVIKAIGSTLFRVTEKPYDMGRVEPVEPTPVEPSPVEPEAISSAPITRPTWGPLSLEQAAQIRDQLAIHEPRKLALLYAMTRPRTERDTVMAFINPTIASEPKPKPKRQARKARPKQAADVKLDEEQRP